MSENVGSKYTQFLPRIFHQNSIESYDEYFLGRFLKAFEQILSGETQVGDTIGIENILERFEQYFDPSQTPSQFLEWLAGWVGLELYESTEFYGAEDMEQRNTVQTQISPLEKKRSTINRNMIPKMVQFYKKRGTLNGLLQYLQLFSGEEVEILISEFQDITVVGGITRIGVNTMVGDAETMFFSVHASIPAYCRSILRKKVELIKKLIDEEKPFYTNYVLSVEVPKMRVGVYARVGRETLLGGMVED